jgi:hypothetical protein
MSRNRPRPPNHQIPAYSLVPSQTATGINPRGRAISPEILHHDPAPDALGAPETTQRATISAQRSVASFHARASCSSFL